MRKKIKVSCRNINNILMEHGLQYIDYCSIDIEGAEFEIVKSLNFEGFDIYSFSIENCYENNEMRDFMKDKGYDLIAVLEADDIYIRRKKKLFQFFRW